MKNKIEEGAAWTKKAGKNPEGGLNQKGVDSYKKENPGSKLKTAVTTKPSKLKKGSKSANRRKSFCARMSGMRKRQKDSNNTGKDRLSLSLKKWNCSTEIVRDARIALAEACWKGYTAYGMKMKNGKQVPNCVPTKASKKKKAIKEAVFGVVERCWSGYEPTPGKKAYSKGSCQPKGKKSTKEKTIEESKSSRRRARRKNRATNAAANPTENRATNAAKGVDTPFDWNDIDARIAARRKEEVADYQQKRDKALARGYAPEDVEVAQAARRRAYEANRKKSPLTGSPVDKPDEVPEKKPELTLRQRAAAQTGKTLPGDPGYDPESQAKIAFDRKQSGRARAIDIRSKKAAAQAAARPAKEEQPEVEKFSGRDKFKRLVRDPKINKQIDDANAKKKEPTVATGVPSPQAPPPNWFTARSAMNTQTRGTRQSDSPYQSRRRPGKSTTGGNVASAKAVAARIKEQPRTTAVDNLVRRNRSSTEIVKNGRMALAEKVLEALSPDETKADPKTREKRMKKGAEAVKNRADKVIAKAKPESKKKAKHTKRDSQGRAGGLHDKEGVPVNTSSNHPDYLKKKLYKRATKDGGYGKEGKPTAADTEVNKQGVRGHEAKIAKKKEKSERQAKAQRISNKIRSMRGLVPLMPGEKHSSDDKLGDTEN